MVEEELALCTPRGKVEVSFTHEGRGVFFWPNGAKALELVLEWAREEIEGGDNGIHCSPEEGV